MITVLLIIIYLSFISLGLPDTLLGSSWPVMQQELGVPLSYAGIASMVISGGTILSSFFSGFVIKLFGTGKVMVFSVFLTAAALLGIAFTPNFMILCLLGIPLGLGGGAVDAALNNFVAIHFKARHMSWLHCFWGIGASSGPIILSLFLAKENGWKWGYGTVGGIQFVLVAILFLSLPLWKIVQKEENNLELSKKLNNEEMDQTSSLSPSMKLAEVFRLKSTKATMITFFTYCAVEVTVGLWGSTYFVHVRGIEVNTAAKWISFYYMGITVGRFVSGLLTVKVNNKNMIRMGEIISATGIMMMLLPLSNIFLMTGLILTGLGFAPIYPCMLHETPKRFGKDLSQQVMGMQMAIAYTGNTLVPPLFGLVAQYISIGWYPGFLLFFMVIMIVAAEVLNLNINIRKIVIK